MKRIPEATSGPDLAAGLLALCRRPPAGADVLTRDFSPTTDEVERLLEMASRRSVTGLVLSALLDAGLELSGPLREQLRTLWSGHRRRARVWLIERDRVTRVLSEAGVEPVVLKGAALSTEWYGEPAHREFGDIDLLVEGQRLPEALSVLQRAGYSLTGDEEVTASYRKHHFHYRLTHPTGFIVELHWGLTRPGALFPLAPEPLFRSARRVEGRPFRIPSPEHMLLHCVHQSLGTGWVQLRRLVDVDRVVGGSPAPDGARLADETERPGLGAAVWLALTMSRSLLGSRVESLLVPRLQPGRATRMHLELLDVAGAAFDERHEEKVALSHLLRFWLLPSARTRLRFLADLGSGEEDPLAFLWEKAEATRPSGDGAAGWKGLGRLTKLASAQLMVYGGAPFGRVSTFLAR